eukprot:TRINITY_DN8290_c0_g1_i3.p1 TRINITY_DN8290_c0_g1~~TRINITY_DN8290_c0_g1_i3.p1  ORF type:complete len:315 (-),score=93.53 TRINITY_DN8290_c0_g1_i3:173-1117(-)
MKVLLSIVVICVAISVTQGSGLDQVQKFFLGLVQSREIPFNMTEVQSAFYEKDVNAELFIQSLKKLASFNPSNQQPTIEALSAIYKVLYDLYQKKLRNLKTTSWVITSIWDTFSYLDDPEAFLRDIVIERKEERLRSVGISTPNFMYYAGYELGSLLRFNSGITKTALFFKGLSEGLGLPISWKDLRFRVFRGEPLALKEVADMLKVLRESPYSADKTIKLVLSEVSTEIQSFQRARKDDIKFVLNLKAIVEEILPNIFRSDAYIDIIQKNNLFPELQKAADPLPEDLEAAARQLGTVLKAVNDILQKKVRLYE